jgi:hypothetical protein
MNISLIIFSNNILIVCDGADLKNKLMGVMVYFYPAEKMNKSVKRLVHGMEPCIFSYSILQTMVRICCITLIHT